MFEGAVAAGFVGGDAFSVDASLIKADVEKKKRVAGGQPMSWPTTEQAPLSANDAVDGAHLCGIDVPKGDCALKRTTMRALVQSIRASGHTHRVDGPNR
jgi:hypothetical protein